MAWAKMGTRQLLEYSFNNPKMIPTNKVQMVRKDKFISEPKERNNTNL